MPLFRVEENRVEKIKLDNFRGEKSLQNIIEENLKQIFGARFVDSEFPIGQQGGRIDTLALDEDGTPVIIEYKWKGKSNVLNQGLFYLDWLMDHRGDFKVVARKRLGEDISVRWESPRLILMAQSFDKYDKFAVNRISESVELKRYRLYDNDLLQIEDVETRIVGEKETQKESVTKAKPEVHTLKEHLGKGSEKSRKLFQDLREKILNLGDDITERFLKHYVAYKLNRNFAEVVLQKNQLRISLDISKGKLEDSKGRVMDKSEKGHWATGDQMFYVKKPEDVDYAIDLIEQSYRRAL